MNKIETGICDYFSILNDLDCNSSVNECYNKYQEEVDRITALAEEQLNIDLLIKRIPDCEVQYDNLDRFLSKKDRFSTFSVLTGKYQYDDKVFTTSSELIEYIKMTSLTPIEYTVDIEEVIDVSKYFIADKISETNLCKLFNHSIDIDVANEVGLTVVELIEPDAIDFSCDKYFVANFMWPDVDTRMYHYIGLKFSAVPPSFEKQQLDELRESISYDAMLKFLTKVGIKEEVARRYLDKKIVD